MSLTYRTLDLLACFTSDQPVRTLSELGMHSGFPLTTTHRIVADLLEWGALERTPDGGLQVELRLWQVGSLAPADWGCARWRCPSWRTSTSRRARTSSWRCRGAGGGVRRAAHGAARGSGADQGGLRFALHATGVGLVLLAHAPEDVRNTVLGRPLRGWTPYTITDPDQLCATLASVLRTGVAVSDRQVTEDARSVACPVFGPRGDVVAALSERRRRAAPLDVTELVDSIGHHPLARRPRSTCADRSG